MTLIISHMCCTWVIAICTWSYALPAACFCSSAAPTLSSTGGAHRPQHTMGRTRKKKSFEQADDASWVQEAKQRLDTVAAQLDESEEAYPSHEAWMRAGMQDLRALRTGEAMGSSSASSSIRTGEQTADLLYRASNEGLFATGYNPWRNTWYVTGRPMQVAFVIPSMYTPSETVPSLIAGLVFTTFIQNPF